MRLDITAHARALGVLAIVATLLAAACGAAPGTGTPMSPAAPNRTPAPDALQVVATTTVLADLVEQVGGERVSVTSLVPKGGEVHTFDPSPSDLARVAAADLIVMNGLGLDEWLAGLIRDSGATAPVVELGEDLDGVEYLESAEGDDDHAEDGHGDEVNPHLWLNVRYAALYAERVMIALVEADPEHSAEIETRWSAYSQRLSELDGWVRERMAAVPQANRKVVSFHEAFPYFAAAYGLEIVGTVLGAPGQDPSAGRIAALIGEIRKSGAKAVFAEAQFGDQLAQTIAAEAGVEVVTDLYSDSLGDPPVDSYEALVRWNVDRIEAALR